MPSEQNKNTGASQPRDSKQPLPDVCHGCGRKNDGNLYKRIEDQCDESTLYFVCRYCGVGVRTGRFDPAEDSI